MVYRGPVFEPTTPQQLFATRIAECNSHEAVREAKRTLKVVQDQLREQFAACFNQRLVFRLKYDQTKRFAGMQVWYSHHAPKANLDLTAHLDDGDMVLTGARDRFDFVDRFYAVDPEREGKLYRQQIPKPFEALVVDSGRDDKLGPYFDVVIDDLSFRVRLFIDYLESIELPAASLSAQTTG